MREQDKCLGKSGYRRGGKGESVSRKQIAEAYPNEYCILTRVGGASCYVSQKVVSLREGADSPE